MFSFIKSWIHNLSDNFATHWYTANLGKHNITASRLVYWNKKEPFKAHSFAFITIVYLPLTSLFQGNSLVLYTTGLTILGDSPIIGVNLRNAIFFWQYNNTIARLAPSDPWTEEVSGNADMCVGIQHFSTQMIQESRRNLQTLLYPG